MGFYFAYLYGRHTKKFRWSEYLFIIIWPVAVIIVLTLTFNPKIITLFVVSMIAGTLFEYLIGLVYDKTLNKKLWVYKKLSIQGYTSVLSMPLWGVAGVIFWAIGKLMQL